MLRDLVLAGRRVLVGQHADRARRMFIDEFQLMLAMYMNSMSIGYGSPRAGVGDDHVHQAVGGERRVPREGLVDALRRAVGVDQQILGAVREAERRPGQRLAGLDVAGACRPA